MTGEKIPNTTLTNILTNTMTLRRMPTRDKWKITWYHVDNHIDQLYDTQQKSDKGTVGELISNTIYHIDKCIDQMTHLFPEIAWSRECNVTLVAFVWLFTTVRFQKSCIQGCSHIGYNCLTFLNCAFSDVSSNDVHKRIHSRIGCICLTFHHYWFFKCVFKLLACEDAKSH